MGEHVMAEIKIPMTWLEHACLSGHAYDVLHWLNGSSIYFQKEIRYNDTGDQAVDMRIDRQREMIITISEEAETLYQLRWANA